MPGGGRMAMPVNDAADLPRAGRVALVRMAETMRRRVAPMRAPIHTPVARCRSGSVKAHRHPHLSRIRRGDALELPMDSTECARILRQIADPVRMEILQALRLGPMDVGSVASAVGVAHYNASRHLSALKNAGVVQARKDQRRRIYALVPALHETGVVDLGCCRLDLQESAPSD